MSTAAYPPFGLRIYCHLRRVRSRLSRAYFSVSSFLCCVELSKVVLGKMDLPSAVMMSIATKEDLASSSRKGIRLDPGACWCIPWFGSKSSALARCSPPAPRGPAQPWLVACVIRSSRWRPNCTSGALTGQGMLGLYVAFSSTIEAVFSSTRKICCVGILLI